VQIASRTTTTRWVERPWNVITSVCIACVTGLQYILFRFVDIIARSEC
jgi:hypothetical protein